MDKLIAQKTRFMMSIFDRSINNQPSNLFSYPVKHKPALIVSLHNYQRLWKAENSFSVPSKPFFFLSEKSPPLSPYSCRAVAPAQSLEGRVSAACTCSTKRFTPFGSTRLRSAASGGFAVHGNANMPRWSPPIGLSHLCVGGSGEWVCSYKSRAPFNVPVILHG